MWFYAQIDEKGKVVSMSQLAGEVKHELLIPLTEEQFYKMGMGWKFADGKWLAPETKIEQ